MTYHIDVPKPETLQSSIPHQMLSSEVKGYLEKKQVNQDRYFFDDNCFYFFIYLNNGDRVDIPL